MNSSRINKYNVIYRKIADGSFRLRHVQDSPETDSQKDIHSDDENHIAVKALKLNKQITKNKGILRFYSDNSNVHHNQLRNTGNSGKNNPNGCDNLSMMRSNSQPASSCVLFSKQDYKATITLTTETIYEKWRVPLSTKLITIKADNVELTDVTVLCENLEHLANLSGLSVLSLELPNNPIGDCSFLQILSVIEGYASLENLSIDIENGGITDASLRCSQVALARITRLRNLQINLKGNQVTAKQISLWIENLQRATIDLKIISDFQDFNIESSNSNPTVVIAGGQQYQQQLINVGGNSNANVNFNTNNGNNIIGLSSQNNPYSMSGFYGNNGMIMNNSFGSQQSFTNQINTSNNTNNYIGNGWNNGGNNNNNNNLNGNKINNSNLSGNSNSSSGAASTTAVSTSNTIQEEDVKRKSPEELAAEKNLEDGYGKGFKILMGLGYKVGKGLGKNDQGITEPVQATNKSKFKENNQRMATVDYFETLTGKTAGLSGTSMAPAGSTPNTHSNGNGNSTGANKMIKFEKKATLVVNNNQLLQEEEGELENTSPSVAAREPGEISSSASGNAKKQPSPFTAFNNPFYGTPHYSSTTIAPTVAPFSGTSGNQAGTTQPQQPFRHQRIM